LEVPAVDYKEFALWQRTFVSSDEAKKQENYWLELLGDDRPILTLPTDYPRKRNSSFAGDRVFVRPSRDLTAALRSLVAKNRVSTYMVLLAAYYILLSKYAGQEDIIVGTLVTGRPEEKFKNVVGLFVNSLLLRSQPKGDLEFVEYLKQVRNECLTAFENQDYQFEDLVDKISPPRDLGRNPLFDTMFGALTYDQKVTHCRHVRITRYELDYEISKFDLSLTAMEYPDQELVLEFEYRTDLFRRKTIERLSAHYLKVIEEVVANPRIKLSEINILTSAERRSLAVPAFKKDRSSVVELFQAQVRERPNATALSFGEKSLSYSELDQRTNALASRLRAGGVRRHDLVGVVGAPSVEIITAILSLLKLGAAYLPIDPATPLKRFGSIVDDSGIGTILLQSQSDKFAAPGLVTIVLDEESQDEQTELSALPVIEADDLAYVIYTSGSTGTPKGVMVTHGTLVNYINWAVKTYLNEAVSSFALHSPLSVDLTVTSLFAPLVSGKRIVIYQADDALSLMEQIVADNQVELIKLTPAHLALLSEVKEVNDRASKLRRLIVGGEDLKTNLAAKIHSGFAGRVEIFNEYGPTEATVGCTVHKYCPDTDTGLSVPIGKAIDNTCVFVLDKYGHPVPGGVSGELCVAGNCLAKGYLNNPQLTEQRFVWNRIGPTSLRMYKTGDVARILPDGTLEFLGRNDDQVKVRGFRIELGEIEETLKNLPQVNQAVVTSGIDPAGDSYLCAYVVLSDHHNAADLRSQLAELLPAHMIPTWFVPLEQFPLGRSGKLDRKALPDPCQLAISGNGYVAPTTRAEVAMTKIWEHVLGHDRIGIDDNFFDLGGQSLKATLMTARVNRELRANIALRDVFAHPVIRELAALAEKTTEDLATLINPVAEQEHYRASSAQKRLYILNKLAPRDVQYNVPWALQITGPFEADRWEQAFRALIARHESLRTSFALIDDEIVQKVHPQVDFAFNYSSSNSGDLQQEIESFVRPFDLTTAPLIRAAVVALGPLQHALIIDTHHIVSDGISMEILLDELCSLYRSEVLEAPSIQYKDYAEWQRNYSSEAIRTQESHWLQVFDGELPVLNLPTDFPREAVQSFEGDLVTFGVGSSIVAGLRAIGRECGATMHMVLLAAYTILLSKYTSQEDIVVGTPVAGRNHELVQNVVGMFANVLAMRNYPRGELTFHDFLRIVKTNALSAYSNQEYQFEELVDKLKIERNLSRNPLFDTVFASLGSRGKNCEIEGTRVEQLDFNWNISKFDLTLLVDERNDDLRFELEYCKRLFKRGTIERLALHYEHVLEQIARRPEQRLEEIELITAAEREQILVEFNGTKYAYPAHQTIHERFEEQVKRAPENVAVVAGEASLSYWQLNQRANQIARILASKEVSRQEVVGIIAEPSIEMMVGILAILKAGGAYLPIDADCPEDRVRAMLDDSKARIVLRTGGIRLQEESRVVLNLSDAELYRGDDSNLNLPVSSHDLAYVIYTSGTTGVPKGVMIEHHSVNNLCAWHIDEFNITDADRATKYARFSFDASVWEIFPYLEAGATLHIIDDQIRLDLARLNSYFEDNAITISFLPTQVCELFMELDNNSLRVLLTGGDRLRRLTPKPYRVVNNYGPTENTVVTTSCEVTPADDRIPIGKPLFNTRVYVLGNANTLLPIGVPGELCIAGVGLARGYVNDPRRTSEKFVANPFAPGEKMYRTGDLVRWLPNGSIEFIGRTDKQVKIRGCRTEPREIEATILAHEAVKDVVVIAQEDQQQNNFLCAYVVWKETGDPGELRSYLARQLPDYMVPAFVVPIEQVPLNSRGKVDLDALPNPDGSFTTGSFVAPRNDSEQRLADIWCALLDRELISVHDNFFEIGGHSLRATVMLAKANREFTADVALGAVFDNPTIASLAQCFDAVTHHESKVIKPAKSRLHYPVTPTQSLLYAVCMARKGVEYNLPFAFELRGDLDVPKLENVFRQLIERHEALRTSFQMCDGQMSQTISPAVDFSIDIREQCDEKELPEVFRDFIRPFDLSVAPLIRVGLVPMDDRCHLLLIDIHHLVGDGTSVGILFEEMAALYAGKKLPAAPVTFKDFAEWLNEHLQTEKVREQEKYWLHTLSDPPPALRLDTDFLRPENFSFDGGRIDFTVGAEMHDGLKTLCAQEGATLYMVLLAAYNVLLSKYTGQKDLIVGVPTVGRYVADVQDVVGMFVSTHAVRSKPHSVLRFNEFLHQVKMAVRGALEHQEYQLWSMMLGHSITTGKPLFGTVFVVQDQAFKAMEIPTLDVKEVDPGYHVSKFDLTLGAVEHADRIDFELEYSTDVFKRSTAKRIASHYKNILEQIIADPFRELRRFQLVSPDEREKLLHDFNGPSPKSVSEANIIEIFEQQAHAAPDRIAVVSEASTLTYSELNRRVNQLARHLRAQGVETGDVVAVMVRPSCEMLVGVLAVLKAGAAYVAISNRFPQRRKEHLLADSGARVLLCDGEITDGRFETTLVNLNHESSYDSDSSNLNLRINAGSVAYVSHVADRDGVLRGVMVDHAALLDRCRWFVERFAVQPLDRSTKYRDLAASATIFELFPFLHQGASIYVVPEQLGNSVERLNDLIQQTGVTISWLPAPICTCLAALENSTLRFLITSRGKVQTARRGKYELVRCYGPVEATEVATSCTLKTEDTREIIGTPITNTQIYILGHDSELLPIGITGELCVGGIGLAHDNRDHDDATASRFTTNPHVADAKLFHTGDSARWLSDGRIELTGRAREVSLDGYRVSLAEIEQQLESHPSIAEAVVLLNEDDPLRPHLISFIVLRGSLSLPPQFFVAELKSHLRQRLPDYMVPDTYVKITMVPRDAQGDVQYEWLKVPKDDSEKTDTPTPTPREVASIVGDVMNIDGVSTEANLSELGIDSLQTMSLMVRLQSAYGVAPTVAEVASASTISEVSHHLSEALRGYCQMLRPLDQESRLS